VNSKQVNKETEGALLNFQKKSSTYGIAVDHKEVQAANLDPNAKQVVVHEIDVNGTPVKITTDGTGAVNLNVEGDCNCPVTTYVYVNTEINAGDNSTNIINNGNNANINATVEGDATQTVGNKNKVNIEDKTLKVERSVPHDDGDVPAGKSGDIDASVHPEGDEPVDVSGMPKAVSRNSFLLLTQQPYQSPEDN